MSKTFGRGPAVLEDVSLQINRGEMVALIGASGSGKSTLIRSIAGLTAINGQNDGRITILDEAMQEGGRITRAAKGIRCRMGMVFQQFNLVPRLSVLMNVCLGCLGGISRVRGTLGVFSMDEKRRAMHALERVGIGAQALKRATNLSGGQQQRAAIARSLVQGADILIADEPIASLDPSSARRVMDILAELNHQDGITVLVSLHQVEYALQYCPRTVALRDGRIVYDGPSEKLTPDFLAELYGDESGSLMLMPGKAAKKPKAAAGRPPPHGLQEAWAREAIGAA
ncbi:MAG: phosphonate ABC transporter ATP-binding protein [Hyphomicrobiaceae bacterium]